MNLFGSKKISEEKKTLLELCKSKEQQICEMTETLKKTESENDLLKEQISALSTVNDELSTRNDHVNNLYDKLKEKYKKLEDEKDVVSVNELTFMNDNLRKERDELLIDKDKLINELAIYKSMFGHIQEIVKDYGNAILEVKKLYPDKIEYGEDVSELYDIEKEQSQTPEGVIWSSGDVDTPTCENLTTNVQCGLMPEGSDLTELTTTGVLEVIGLTNTSNEDDKTTPLNDKNEDSELVEIRKIRKIAKSNFDVLDCTDKRTVYIIVQNEDEEETVCFDEPTFAKIIKSYCDAKEDSLEEVTNPILNGPYSDVW